MTAEKLAQIAKGEQETQSRLTDVVNVCVASGCLASKSDSVKQALESELADRGLSGRCQVKGVGCLGLCAKGPLVSTRSGAI